MKTGWVYLFLIGQALSSADVWDCPVTTRENRVDVTDCSNKRLVTIPRNLPPRMKKLDLSDNFIQRLSVGDFARFSALHTLKLSRNSIRSIHMDAFRGLLNLRILDLSYNNLSAIPTSSFYQFRAGLLHLKLDGNPLIRIGAERFPNLQQLEILELEDCTLELIHEQAFRGLARIAELNLSRNKLRNVNPKVFQFFRNTLQQLQIDRNQWQCDCELRSLYQWVTQTMAAHVSWDFGYGKTPRCSSPPRLKGTKWTNLSRNELTCAPEITYTYNSGHTLVGDDIYLRCSGTGYPQPQFKWLENNKSLAGDTDNLQIYHSFRTSNVSTSLRISNFTKNEAVYVCMASNTVGNATHHFYISVQREGYKDSSWSLPVTPLLAVISILLTIFSLITICCVWIRKRMHQHHRKMLRLVKRRAASEKSSQVPLQQMQSNDDTNSDCYSYHFKINSHQPDFNKSMLEKYLNDQQRFTPQVEHKGIIPQPMSLAEHFNDRDNPDSGACTMTTAESDRDIETAKDDDKEEPLSVVTETSGRSSKTPVPVPTPAIPLHLETDIISNNWVTTKPLLHNHDMYDDYSYYTHRRKPTSKMPGTIKGPKNEHEHHVKEQIDNINPYAAVSTRTACDVLVTESMDEDDLIKVLSVDI